MRPYLSTLVVAVTAAFVLSSSFPVAEGSHPCDNARIFFHVPLVLYVVYDEQEVPYWPLEEWIFYLESNGEDGLQRGGESLLLGYDDHCVQSENPDIYLF